jgi:hypothetical protein
VLVCAHQSNRPEPIQSHLAHSPEDVLATHTNTAAQFIGGDLFSSEWVPTPRLEQDEVLAVFFE